VRRYGPMLAGGGESPERTRGAAVTFAAGCGVIDVLVSGVPGDGSRSRAGGARRV